MTKRDVADLKQRVAEGDASSEALMNFESSIGGAPAPKSHPLKFAGGALSQKLTGQGALAGLAQKKRKRVSLSIWSMAIDLLCISTAFVAASFARHGFLDYEQVTRILVILLPIYTAISLNNRAHKVTALIENFKSANRAASAFFFAAASILLVAFFLKIGEDFSRLLFGIGALIGFALLIAWRNALAIVSRRYLGASPFATLCIYDDVQKGASGGDGSIVASDWGLSPDPNDPMMVDNLGQLAQDMDSVVVHCSAARRTQWAFMLKSLDVPAEIVLPELDALRPLAIARRSGQTSLVLTSGTLDWNQRLVKRCFDLVVTLAILPVLAPLLFAVAIAIKIDSPGPIFFKQDRIGLGNRKFKILKFRSMRVDMQDERAEKLTERDDPRVTRVGNFIRKTSIDELPQFLNVLLGDMSLVGPRPHAELALAGKSLYWEVDTSYWHRHVVKPGITGLAQVRGYRGNTFHEQQLRDRLDADLEYVSNWSLLADVKILIQTAGVLFHNNAF